MAGKGSQVGVAIHIPTTMGRLSEGWRWSHLEEVCSGVFDCPHSTPTLTDNGPLIARSQDIRPGVFRTEQAARVSEETYEDRIRRAEPKHGDLLYSREGTYFGIAAEVPPGSRVCLGQRMVLLRPDAGKIHFRYLRYWLNSGAMARHIHGFRDGTVAERLNLPTIRQLAVPIAPMPVQCAIAHILGTLDDKIELNRRMNETLEAMARAIFKRWFVDFDPVRTKMDGCKPLGLDAATAALFPDSFQESELGHIPAGWTIGTLDEICGFVRRTVQPNQFATDTPYIGLEHMPRRSITLNEWGRAGEVDSTKAKFERGEILFGKLRPYFHKVGLAPFDGVCSTDILTITPKEDVWLGFALFHLSSDEVIDHADACSTGTKMPRVNAQDLARYGIVMPPAKLAARFSDIVRPMLERCIIQTTESRRLAAIRDALLPKLLSGELSPSECRP